MQRLSGLDASFRYLETSDRPMHMCSIVELTTSTMPGGSWFLDSMHVYIQECRIKQRIVAHG
jgi:hypothetical protein